MKLLFVSDILEELYGTFQTYNLAIWPMVIVTYLLGIIAVILALKQSKYSSKAISSILTFFWLWVGVVFCILFFGPTTAVMLGQTIPAFWYIFGVFFIIQSILFFIYGVARSTLSFKFDGSLYSVVGTIMIVYAMIIYPIIGFLTGHDYPAYPIFGVAPCPVMIFTFGLLLWTNRKVSLLIPTIPFIISLIGVVAAFEYEIWADVGLFITGIIGFYMILRHNAELTRN